MLRPRRLTPPCRELSCCLHMLHKKPMFRDGMWSLQQKPSSSRLIAKAPRLRINHSFGNPGGFKIAHIGPLARNSPLTAITLGNFTDIVVNDASPSMGTRWKWAFVIIASRAHCLQCRVFFVTMSDLVSRVGLTSKWNILESKQYGTWFLIASASENSLDCGGAIKCHGPAMCCSIAPRFGPGFQHNTQQRVCRAKGRLLLDQRSEAAELQQAAGQFAKSWGGYIL